MKIYESIADNKIMKKFKDQRGQNLMNLASNTCGIENTIAVSALLCPEIVVEKDCIFISEFYNGGGIENLEKQFNYNRKNMEMFVNSWSLSEFFFSQDESLLFDESSYDDTIVEEFGKILQYFWDRRLRELFPDKNIVVELGYELMGETGLAITLYQV